MLARMIWERYRSKIYGIHVHMQLSHAQGLTYWGKRKQKPFIGLPIVRSKVTSFACEV